MAAACHKSSKVVEGDWRRSEEGGASFFVTDFEVEHSSALSTRKNGAFSLGSDCSAGLESVGLATSGFVAVVLGVADLPARFGFFGVVSEVGPSEACASFF